MTHATTPVRRHTVVASYWHWPAQWHGQHGGTLQHTEHTMITHASTVSTVSTKHESCQCQMTSTHQVWRTRRRSIDRAGGGRSRPTTDLPRMSYQAASSNRPTSRKTLASLFPILGPTAEDGGGPQDARSADESPSRMSYQAASSGRRGRRKF